MSVLPLTRWLHRADPPRTAPASNASAAPTGADDAVVGRLLDAIGTLVQVVGMYAHDTDARAADDARRVAEQWRRHLTLGLVHPAAADDEPDAPRPAGGLATRDWEGAARFAVAERRAEHAHVTRTTSELRDAIWTLVKGLHEVAAAESAAGQSSGDTLRRIRTSVAAGDPTEVRGLVLAALGELSEHLAQRERARDRQLATLGEQVAALDAALDEARREGATDPLTGIGNRRAFDAAVEHAIALHGLWRQPITLVMLDVDGLKAINDALGHAAGDEVLVSVAGRLSRVFLRRSDVLARVGGDEFAVLLRDTPAEEGARMAARAIALVSPADGKAPRVGISAGVAALHAGESSSDWYARADAALYAAKRGGRARVEIAG
jgi:diguanylate cyclase